MNSEDVRNYYSTFINSAATIARNFGAKVIKNVGDSLIYYFPSTIDSSNERAFNDVLECCVTMNASSSAISAKLIQEGLPPMQYRISAEYGKVELATTKTSQDYDFFGSTINLCSKINKLTAPDKILIGGDLFRILKSLPCLSNDYNFRPAGEYSVGLKLTYFLYTVTCKYDRPIVKSFTQIPDLKPLSKNSLYSTRQNLQVTSRTARVLLVDDDNDILYTFHSVLKSEGIQVYSYQDPLEALKHFNDHDYYDLVILDIRMPGINGLQLYYKLREINRDFKVLFVSALEMPNELVNLLPGIKTDSILKKPLEMDQFVSAVKNSLPAVAAHK